MVFFEYGGFLPRSAFWSLTGCGGAGARLLRPGQVLKYLFGGTDNVWDLRRPSASGTTSWLVHGLEQMILDSVDGSC